MELPNNLRWFLVQKSISFIPWHIEEKPRGLSNVFKSEDIEQREVFVFAYRQDCDDLAGFLVIDGEITDQVIYFHPSYTSNPKAQRESDWSIVTGEYNDIFEFFAAVVVSDMREWALTDDAEEWRND